MSAPNIDPASASPPNRSPADPAETPINRAAVDGRDPAAIQAPPLTPLGILARIGPGLILVGNIVGTGELIVTPRLAAEAGFVFLWLLLFSCVIKVCFQIEIGRATVSGGQTTLSMLNGLPGRVGPVHWLLLLWLVLGVTSIIQQGATVGGTAQCLRLALPITEDPATCELIWALVVAAAVSLLLWIGRYQVIEWSIIVLVSAFTFLTLYTVIAIQFDPARAITLANIIEGFSFKLPEDPEVRSKAFGTAMTAFGITGVGAAELLFYPYWCLEKGYARFTGPRPAEGTVEHASWANRAKGWMRVMRADAWLGMVVFTVATIAFYLLGAVMLHPAFLKDGTVPQDRAMIERLSVMYSSGFGTWGRPIFLVGSIGVLLSTAIVTCASYARMLPDWLILSGLVPADRPELRERMIRGLSVSFPIIAGLTYIVWPEPVSLVRLNGLVQALLLPFLGWAILHFAYRLSDRALRSGPGWYAALWISYVLMSAASIWMAWNTMRTMFGI